MSRSRLFLALFLTASLHAVEVSRPEIIVPAPYTRSMPEMATNGTNTLVVWLDRRPGNTTTVRGALLDDQGRPTGPHDFGIASSSLFAGVTSNGSEYLVASNEARLGRWTGELRLSVVTGEGRVRASNVVPGQFVSITVVRGDYYAVVYRGDAFFVVILDADAKILQPGVLIGPNLSYAMAFGTSDGRLLMTWSTKNWSTRAGFVSTAELAQGRFVPVSVSDPLWIEHAHAAMVETPQGFVLVWNDTGLKTALLDHDGAIIENVRDAYELGPGLWYRRDAVILPTTAGLTAVESRGDRPEGPFGIPSSTIEGVATRRLDAGRNAVGDFELFDDASWHVAAAPARGGGGLVAYDHFGTQQIRTRRVTPAGAIEAGSDAVARSLPSQDDAVVQRCGDTTFIAWLETMGPAGARLLYRRFDDELRPLDPPNVVAATTPWASTTRPLLACGNSSALLAWQDAKELHALLFPDVAATPRPITLGKSSSYPTAITFDGTGYVIVRGPAVDRWNESGELLLSSPNAAEGLSETAIGWNGSELLLAGRVSGPNYQSIAARRLDRNFNRIGADLAVRSSTTRWWDRARVASSDGMWLVTWIEQESVNLTFEPRSMRITRSGTALDPDGGVVSGPQSKSLAVTWNGSAFELLTEHAITRRTPDGDVKTFPLLDEDAWLLAIDDDGESPLVVYWRTEPVHEVRRLFADRVARTWSRPQRERQRPARP